MDGRLIRDYYRLSKDWESTAALLDWKEIERLAAEPWQENATQKPAPSKDAPQQTVV